MLPVDLPTLIRAIGYLGVAALLFAESGLLIGFFPRLWPFVMPHAA